jgi:hypothetical protein
MVLLPLFSFSRRTGVLKEELVHARTREKRQGGGRAKNAKGDKCLHRLNFKRFFTFCFFFVCVNLMRQYVFLNCVFCCGYSPCIFCSFWLRHTACCFLALYATCTRCDVSVQWLFPNMKQEALRGRMCSPKKRIARASAAQKTAESDGFFFFFRCRGRSC